MDAASAEIVKQGIGYALFILACGAIGIMWLKINSLHSKIGELAKAYTDEIKAIHEKRLVESREVVLAMERSTNSAVERNATIQAQSAAINDLTKGFAALVLTSENSRTRFGEVATRLEGRQEDILRSISDLPSRLGPSAHAPRNLPS